MIADNLIKLANIKQDIKQAINEKGVSVGNNMTTYANAIRNIPSGGSSKPMVEPRYITKLPNYPDLSNLNTVHGSIYFVMDNRNRDARFYCLINIASDVYYDLELGHIEGNEYVKDETLISQSRSNPSVILNVDADFPILRLTNVNYAYFSTNTYSAEGVNVISMALPIVEIIQDVDFNLTVANASYYFNKFVEKYTVKNVTNVCTSLSYLCRNGYSLYDVKFINCDFSNVTKMEHMFANCNSLESLDLSGFDTSNVTSMSSMFTGCYSLKSLDLSGFDTSNVTGMNSMFSGCYSLESLDLSSFDTSNVNNMNSMFQYCYSLEEVIFSLDTTTPKLTSATYFNTNAYNIKRFISNIDLSKVNSVFTINTSPLLSEFYIGAYPNANVNLNNSDLTRECILDIFSKLPTVTTAKTLTLGVMNLNKVTDSEKAVAISKGWTLA